MSQLKTPGDEPSTAVPSATILLLRDGAEGIEVFMVVRHHQIDFASGALVFPGGKLDEGDRDPGLRQRCILPDGGAALDDEALALRIGAIREAFEESGVLLAYGEDGQWAGTDGSGALADPAAAAQLETDRTALHDGQLAMASFLETHGLTVDLRDLVPYAHWITPDFMRRRYDTHFFLARCPGHSCAVHDGSESVGSVWINPARALAEAEEGQWTIIFPTRMNLLKLSRSGTVAEALEAARQDPVVTVKPWVEERAEGAMLCIPEEAGYGVTSEPLERM